MQLVVSKNWENGVFGKNKGEKSNSLLSIFNKKKE